MAIGKIRKYTGVVSVIVASGKRINLRQDICQNGIRLVTERKIDVSYADSKQKVMYSLMCIM
jgi:hypothetical protein